MRVFLETLGAHGDGHDAIGVSVGGREVWSQAICEDPERELEDFERFLRIVIMEEQAITRACLALAAVGLAIQMARLARADLFRRWQCSSCRWAFVGRWQSLCPACGRRDYWSGSVAPDAKIWSLGLTSGEGRR